jgi:hypothetical protein
LAGADQASGSKEAGAAATRESAESRTCPPPHLAEVEQAGGGDATAAAGADRNEEGATNRNKKGAVRVMKIIALHPSPEQTKKKQEDADRVMKELLEEEEKAAGAAAAASEKKKQAKTDKLSRRHAAEGQDVSQKEEHAKEHTDAERTETTAESEKKKTEIVATSVGGYGNESGGSSYPPGEYFIRMRGIPYSAHEPDIIDFYQRAN